MAAKKKAPAAPAKELTLKEVAGKVSPKAARRILREAKLSFHTPRGRWVFTAAQAAEARKVLAS